MHRLWVVLLVGCYSPAPYAPCQTACASNDQCQPGFVCGGRGLCRPPGLDDDACATAPDARDPDAIVADAKVPGSTCLGDGFLEICIAPGELPTNDEVLPPQAALFDTDGTATPCTRVHQQAGRPDVCVVIARNYTIPVSGSLRVVGSRPLAIVATQNLTIDGLLDASSQPGTDASVRGGGAVENNLVLCSFSAIGTTATQMTAGAGGGAGGSLVTAGGNGGEGDGGNVGGAAGGTRTVTFPRGGCSGGRGGLAGTTPGGSPGFGGGALYLIAGDTLSVAGKINASGAGSLGGNPRAGGGGGGSGGFIGLDAPAYNIMATARIYASGGSGSSGGGAMSGGFTGASSDTEIDPRTTTGADGGGDGGAGHSSIAGQAGGPATSTGAGGGGGGGGGGFIGIANSAMITPGAIIRPTAVPMAPPGA